jgi:hypothetical protein
MGRPIHEHIEHCRRCGEAVRVWCEALPADDGGCDAREPDVLCGACEPEPTEMER